MNPSNPSSPVLSLLTSLLEGEAEYKALAETLSAFKKGGGAYRAGPCYATGLCDSLRAVLCHMLSENPSVCAGMSQDMGISGKVSLLLVPEEKTAYKYYKMLSAMTDGVFVFPQRDIVLHNISAVSHEFEHERMSVLKKALGGKARIIIAVPEAALGIVPSVEDTAKETVLKSGSEYSPDKLTEELLHFGYVRSETVEGKGQFARRGDILDIFPPTEDLPVRIEYYGDEIDTINTFDLMTQRRGDSLETLSVTPTREILLSKDDIRIIEGEIDKNLAVATKKCASAEKAGDRIKAADFRSLCDRLAAEKESLSLGSLPCADKYLTAIGKSGHTLFDYINGYVMTLEFPNVRERLKNAVWQASESVLSLAESGEAIIGGADYIKDFGFLSNELCRRPTVICDTFTADCGMTLSGLFSFITKDTGSFTDGIDILCEDIEAYAENNYRVVILTGSAHSGAALSQSLSDGGRLDSIGLTPILVSPDEISPERTKLTELSQKVVYIVPCEGTNPLSVLSGFELRRAHFAVLSEGAVEGSVEGRKKRRSAYSSRGKSNAKKILSYADLSVGDYVVHSIHGIGRYEGIRTLTSEGKTRDYITLTYAAGDTVYVPADQLDRVAKYAGGTEQVKLSRLGNPEWQKTKTRVKKAAKDMAKELIALYAARTRLPGYAFSADGEWQKDFEGRFEYDETDGQLEATAEIKKDMEKQYPMDRILCGDVGFGKTEVALRAMFKCTADGKQAAILVPTTILAWQHFRTLRSRMQGFPVNIEMISRFRSAKQVKEILKKLETGEIDMIVGTHRLLSKDVVFHDLGLLVVDEEQRFGVTHKEKLKQMAKCVDVLTLSATPIPRTLNMAMAGIRDMSVLEEAPQDRYPVQTYVIEYDREIIMDAIRKELRRGGQVFFLRNKIEGIQSVAADIKAAVPDAEVAVAHGRMTEEELSDIWRSLVDGEIDVLVCTTIIETGVDVPNANTLIIENADCMGLSQLHQVRGRVGRSNRRAYAYLTWRKGEALSEIAKKRLDAIREYTEFGSGFKIAMRDLEIRGAGNLLGAEQSGHMDAVGYDLFIKLLEEAVLEEKGILPEVKPECNVELGTSAYIPESYIHAPAARIEAYKKIAQISCDEDSYDVTEELCDRYGDMPKATVELIHISRIRARGSNAGLKKIELIGGKNLRVYPPHAADREMLSRMLEAFRGKVLYTSGATPCFTVKMSSASELDAALDKIFTLYMQNDGKKEV